MNKLDNFYKEYKQIFELEEEGNEWTSQEYLCEIGELCVKYNLNDKDVLYVLNNYNTKFDFNDYLKIIYDDWFKFDEPKKYYTWLREDGEYSQTTYNNLEDIDEFEKAEAKNKKWKLMKIEEISF